MKSPIVLAAALLACSASAQPVGSRYVAMGSSYAAGPGVGAPDPASAACARSLSNYARQVAAKRHLTLVDVSCSGATTENILTHGQYGFAAQIEAVTSDTRLVTILIGGNDVAYVGTLMGLSCRDRGGSDCHTVGIAEIERRFSALPDALDQVIAEVRRRAPAARIILVDYLPAVPSAGSTACAALPLTAPDIAQMRDVALRLAQTIGGAAARNGTDIVRASVIGAGHDVCSTKRYLAGDHPARTPGWPMPIPYHPTQDGMDRVAKRLDQVLGQ